jgi:hypothetical protein
MIKNKSKVMSLLQKVEVLTRLDRKIDNCCSHIIQSFVSSRIMNTRSGEAFKASAPLSTNLYV